MGESDDDLERMFRLEYSPTDITRPAPAPVDTWSSPRHSPADVATESAPAGATAAARLARSRELHGGWRWTPEQKQLRGLVRAQQQVGAELNQLTHVGARVLHARRAPNSAQPIDHIVVNARGVFVVVDLLPSSEQPLTWHASGHLSSAGVSMRLFEETLVAVARNGLGVAEHILGDRWRVPVEPIVVIAGAWPWPSGSAASGVTVCAQSALRHGVNAPLTPALFDATDVAVIADAVARVFPTAT